MKRIFIHLMIFVLCTSSFGLNVPLITINSSDNIGDSRTNINENFSQLSNAVLCVDTCDKFNTNILENVADSVIANKAAGDALVWSAEGWTNKTLAGTGDFLADGTIPMTANIDNGGFGITNTAGYTHSHATNKYNAIPLYGTNFVIVGTNGNRFVIYPTNDYQIGFGPEWGTNCDGDCKFIIPSNAYSVVWTPLVSTSSTNIGVGTTPLSVILADHSYGETNWDVYRLK